jgi:hypothetical protein
MCTLPNVKDFNFVYSKSQKKDFEPSLTTGIRDMKANKIYPISMRTLLHFGSYQLHCVRTCEILQSENEAFIKEQ